MESTLHSLEDLGLYAEAFLASVPQGAVVGLSGDLGAGKTAFVRAVVECLAGRAGRGSPRVVSPSFVLHQHYALGPTGPTVDHFDLYRLDTAEEAALLELGYFEIRDQSRAQGGLVFVEWPERARPLGLLGLTDWISIRREGEARLFSRRPGTP